MTHEPQATQTRALELLKAIFATSIWPASDARRLIWAIRFVIALGVLLLIASAVDKPLWAWLELLIVPAVLAVGGFWFNQRQQARAEMSDNQRAQDEALQAYLDKMSELLIDKKLHEQSDKYDETRVTARAPTLTVLSRLDAKGKRAVLLFLREARLINRYDFPREQGRAGPYYAEYVGLEGADLSGADLQGTRLISTSTKEPISLKGANLKCANLSEADLREADLSKADLSGADLSGADLSGANLEDARGWTIDQLRSAFTLKGATMPDGSIYP